MRDPAAAPSVLRGQPGLFGPVASVPTATRTLSALADDGAIDATVAALDVARAQLRRRAWESGALPVPLAAALEGGDAGPLAIDLDATLVIAHSDDKDGAGKTYKRTWGFHPMTAWLDRGDGSGEALAIELRRGNAGANTAADQIRVLDRALGQLPELPDELAVLVRADTAGAVHDLVDHIRGHGLRFSVGMPFQDAVRTTIHDLDADDRRWVQALTQDGRPRRKAAAPRCRLRMPRRRSKAGCIMRWLTFCPTARSRGDAVVCPVALTNPIRTR